MKKHLFIGMLLLLLTSVFKNSYGIEFTENKGQWNEQALFKANLKFGNVFLLNDGFLFTIHDKKQLHEIHETGFQYSMDEDIQCHSYKITFLNALPATVTTAQQKSAYRNYFIGTDSEKWKGNVNSYGEIIYQNIYKNIDLKVYSANGNFKYDFILNPGAEVSQIKLKVEGLNDLILKDRSLNYVTGIATLEENIPLAYIESANQKQKVACNYLLTDKNIIQFNIPNFKPLTANSRLIIDPVLLISTYSGSSGTTYGSSATYDTQGNLFIGALLFDTGWPYTLGAYDVSFAGGIDMGITKFDVTGSNQIWSTYIGGVYEDVVLNLAANSNDKLFVFGYSYQNYPVTPGSFDISPNGQNDIVVSKLSAAGNTLLASTYVGGNDDDGRSLSLSMNVHSFGDLDKGELQIDANGNPVIATLTMSPNFPVTPGAYQTAFGGSVDACVFKLNSSLTQMMYSSFIGGTDDEASYGMSLDANGNTIITGGTNSTNFPITTGAYQTNYAGGFSYQYDSFISVIDATGNNLLASTYFGYNNEKDKGYKTAVDTSGNIYVFGNTEGTLPISPGVFSTQNTGNYLLKLNPSLTTLLKCTAYGDGTAFPNLQPIAFHIDGCNQVYCAGFTSSTFGNPNQFPVTPGAFQSSPNGTQDAHVLVFAPDFASVIYGSYIGGAVREHTDAGSSKFDANGVLYLGVCTEESFMGGFPVTPNAFCPTSQTPDWDMAGVKWDFNGCPLTSGVVPSVAISSTDSTWCDKKAIDFFDLSTNNPTSWQWYFPGAVPDTSTLQNPTGIYYASSGTFPVTLVACNSIGCDSVTFSTFINELPTPPQPTVTLTGNTLCATGYVAYLWYETANPTVVLSTDSCFTPTTFGSYFVLATDTNGCESASQTIVTGINFITGLDLDLKCFPNPFSENITIEINSVEANKVSVLVIDVNGRTIENVQSKIIVSGDNKIILDLSELQNGIYFCKINYSGCSSILKMIKQN